jgi:NADH-quinone oxidoreductase subunit L
MFLAVGSGAYVAAIFHMVTHAFFKALLFLGSGSVIHGMHHEQDMRKMGALRKLMPVTAITFIIGWLAIAGVPPFAGFWSKDEILLFAYDKSPILYVLGLVTAILTAYYMTRQVIMTFFGEAKWKTADESRHALAAHGDESADPQDAHVDELDAHDSHGEHTPAESPVLMLLPLVVLAGLSIVGGLIQLPGWFWIPNSVGHRLETWLEPVIGGGEHELSAATTDIEGIFPWLAIACALVGIAASYMVYAKKKAKAIEPAILAEGWKYDALVSNFMGGPGRQLFDGITTFDAKVVDGAVNGVGLGTQGVAGLIRKAQSGFVRVYALAISLGVIALLAWFVLKGIL